MIIGGMKMDARRFGARLRNIRNAKKLTILEVAQKAGLSKTGVRQLEVGRSNPTVETLVKLANALEVDFDTLLCDSIHADVDRLEQEILKIYQTAAYKKDILDVFGVIKRCM